MQAEQRTPQWKIAVAWAVVLVPLAWGVSYSIKGAINLLGGK